MDPLATIKRIVEAVTFRRRVYVWMQFESDATGDAIVIVAITSFALALLAGARFTVNLTISRAINSLVAWLLIAALTWAAAKWHCSHHWPRQWRERRPRLTEQLRAGRGYRQARHR